jgi:hypothetical protein
VLFTIHILIQAGLITQILLRQHRDPASRIAWIVVVLALPMLASSHIFCRARPISAQAGPSACGAYSQPCRM